MLDDIVLFLTIGATVAFALYLKYRTRYDLQETVRAALARGETLSPELVETLSASLVKPFADLRRGIIYLAVGAATLLFAFMLGEQDAERPLLGIAMFPILIGLGYLGLWYGTGRKAGENGKIGQ